MPNAINCSICAASVVLWRIRGNSRCTRICLPQTLAGSGATFLSGFRRLPVGYKLPIATAPPIRTGGRGFPVRSTQPHELSVATVRRIGVSLPGLCGLQCHASAKQKMKCRSLALRRRAAPTWAHSPSNSIPGCWHPCGRFFDGRLASAPGGRNTARIRGVSRWPWSQFHLGDRDCRCFNDPRGMAARNAGQASHAVP